MTIEKAHKLLDNYFEKTSHLAFVSDPVAYALYLAWEQAEREKKNEGNEGNEGNIKSATLCANCNLGYDNWCYLRSCDECENTTEDGACNCMYIKDGEICPYYSEKEGNNGRNKQTASNP